MKISATLVVLAYLSQVTLAKLRLLSIVFRHGDRAPDSRGFEAYPKDPYANTSFFPMGPGGLTNEGKQREFQLGKYLRKEYGKFLGGVYYPEVLDARSTFIDRTKMSLQLVLAGLYPPESIQQWDPYVPWQPIPTRFVPHLDDLVTFGYECPRYLKELSRVIDTPEFQANLAKYKPLMRELTEGTGKNVTSSVDMFFLYLSLTTVAAMNLELPEWSRDQYPYGQLYYGYLLQYDLFSYTDMLTRLNGGMMLRKVVDDMNDACSGRLDGKRKLYLYSAHEINVAAMLKALNVYVPHVPRYSSAVIVELHKMNRKCFVKVKYYKGIVDEGEPITDELNVPGGETGQLREFQKVLRNHIATDDDIDSCNKRDVPKLLKTYTNIPKGLTDTIVKAVQIEEEEGPLT